MTTRAKVAVAVATGMVVFCATVALAWKVEGRTRTDGPIALPYEHGWALAVPVGDSFTDGFEVLHVKPGSSITIDDVRLVGDVDGLRLMGAQLGYLDREAAPNQYFRAYPPRTGPGVRVLDAIGATVTGSADGGDRPELLVGIELVEEGAFERTGILIAYTSDGQEYQATLPAHLIVCAKSTPFEADCDL